MRLSEKGLVWRLVSLALRKSNNEKIVSLSLGTLRSLALPPSPSRGALAISGLYSKVR